MVERGSRSHLFCRANQLFGDGRVVRKKAEKFNLVGDASRDFVRGYSPTRSIYLSVVDFRLKHQFV